MGVLTNPLNRRRSGCPLPTRHRQNGNWFPIRMKNHHCVQGQEQREPVERLLRAQKPLQALAEPQVNLVRRVSPAYALKRLLASWQHC